MDEQTANSGENRSDTLNIEPVVNEAVRSISEAALRAGEDAANAAKAAGEAATRSERAGLEVQGMIQDALRTVREMAA
jgi:hypothetical protein